MKKNSWFLVPGLCALALVLFVLQYMDDANKTNPQALGLDKNAVVDEQEEGVPTSTSNLIDMAEQHRRRLWYEADAETIARYKAVQPGYRRHPVYYSDKYLTRGNPNIDHQALDQKWGSWKLVDTKRDSRPGNDFYDKYPSRDVPWKDFPDTAWQKDPDYLPKFLDEGIALVERAMEGILAEYGFQKDDRPVQERIKPIANMVRDHGNTHQGLVRRLLHAIITEDSFVFGMSGHSAAAGHANHAQQSYTHAVGQIMEPIMARLGVLFTSRNFGYGGLGTMQTAVATSDLVGPDLDLLMWDSGMTEKGDASRLILWAQSIMGGDKIPIFLNGWAGCTTAPRINKEVGADLATFTVFQNGPLGSFPIRKTEEELNATAFAARCMIGVAPEINALCPRGRLYRSNCWIDRSNFEWGGMNLSYVPSTPQRAAMGGQVGWHPGDRVHQWTGRQITAWILNGLLDAFKLWKNSENLVLRDEDWHVNNYYDSIRTNFTTVMKDEAKNWCRNRIPMRFCMVAMQGRTEFTPRYDAARKSIRTLMKVTHSENNKYKPALYDPPEVFNPALVAPEGEVDVLGIVENGVDFAPNLARIHRRDNLFPADFEPPRQGSSVNPEIVPGKGWLPNDNTRSSGLCDGEYEQWCSKQDGEACLMTNQGDIRIGVGFDGLSGWGIFELPNLRHGFIVIKYHSWFPPNAVAATAGWTTENNASIVANGRNLKGRPPPYCPDFKFEYALDGVIHSMNLTEWNQKHLQPQRVVEFTTILDDPDFTGGQTKDVELAMRITGCGRAKPLFLTHLYWA